VRHLTNATPLVFVILLADNAPIPQKVPELRVTITIPVPSEIPVKTEFVRVEILSSVILLTNVTALECVMAPPDSAAILLSPTERHVTMETQLPPEKVVEVVFVVAHRIPTPFQISLRNV